MDSSYIYYSTCLVIVDLNCYNSNMSIHLINEDYKLTIKKIVKSNLKVNAIITDPPYGVSRKHQLGFSNMGRAGMDYGEWDYNIKPTEWIKLIGPIIHPDGCLITFCDWKNFSLIVNELEHQGFYIKDLIRWEKLNPMPRNVKSRYVMDVEFAIWAVKNPKKWTFNKPISAPYLKPKFISSIVAGGSNRIHPTQKSLKLMEFLIENHTKKGELVFDPFGGSFTTGLAAFNLNRSFIGSEINKVYYEKSLSRFNCKISTELSGQ